VGGAGDGSHRVHVPTPLQTAPALGGEAGVGKFEIASYAGCGSVMTPAAINRLSYGGEESEEFLRIGSALIIAAPVFLAAGIAAETYVVAQKVFEDVSWCMTGALATFGGMIFLWYAVPLFLKARIRRAALPL